MTDLEYEKEFADTHGFPDDWREVEFDPEDTYPRFDYTTGYDHFPATHNSVDLCNPPPDLASLPFEKW